MIKMLEYEKQVFLDILQDDGLVVVAKGLGLDSVILNLLKIYCDPGNLVFVLGAEGQHQEWLLKCLKAMEVNPQPRVINFEVGVAERQKSYLDGGVWFVPPRILVVDMIKKRIPIDLITGFIVCKAHNILKNHQDGFVLRLFKKENKVGFIKAFSDQAPLFKKGFNKTEQILKALFVRKLLLWPRYHAIVKNSLSLCKPTVIELHLEMSQKMLQLQNALLDLIKLTVQELKRLNPTLDTEEITVENAITDSLHKVLHLQLDPVWYALSERSKALLADLKLFHYMILSLLTQDSVSFYACINSHRKSENAAKGSGWHFLPSAEVVFVTARQRVFPKDNSDISDINQLDAEPNPKWLVLSEVLMEIHKEFAKSKGHQNQPKIHNENDINEDNDDENIEKKLEHIFGIEKSNESQTKKNVNEDNSNILILTKDERSCSQLQMYLTHGSEELLRIQFKKFFSKKIMIKKLVEENINSSPTKCSNDLNEYEETDDLDDCDADTYTLSLNDQGFSKLEEETKVNIAGYFEDSLSLSQKNCLLNTEITQIESESSFANKPAPTIIIKSYRKNLLGVPQILEELKPRWIVIYDPDMTIVRQLEVYQRKNSNIQIKIYFFVFGGTVEEQAYLTSLRNEKDAFDFLIEEKSRIVIPEDINDFPELNREELGSLELVNKRKGGIESPQKAQSKIIVDMREFRSELPALIHSRGIEIEPLTITIGDYILTPDICLERKSISDLIQSLNSGRLYNQALEMTRYYSRPMLLIEFDKDKPFDLQDRYYLSTDASSEQLVSKLQLLTLHFPQLRLIWSPNPHATAQLFEELKQGHPEPNAETVLTLGIEQNATDEDKFNPGIQKLLSNLLGVTSKNIYSLLLKGKSLDYLRTLSKEDITNIIENSNEAELIYDSIHKKHLPDETSSSINSNKNKFKSGTAKGKRKRFC